MGSTSFSPLLHDEIFISPMKSIWISYSVLWMKVIDIAFTSPVSTHHRLLFIQYNYIVIAEKFQFPSPSIERLITINSHHILQNFLLRSPSPPPLAVAGGARKTETELSFSLSKFSFGNPSGPQAIHPFTQFTRHVQSIVCQLAIFAIAHCAWLPTC